MNRFNIAALGLVAGAIAMISVAAASTPLAVTCSGSVSNNVITWTASPSGGNGSYAVLWSGDSTVAGNTNASIVLSYSANGTYNAMIKATDASSTVATSTCSATVTSIVPPPTPTSTPKFNVPMLNINPGGHFLARGMMVTGISSGSFQGQVWGITYTVNWSGNLRPEFLFRDGKDTTSTIPQQLQVGDEVGVSGKVDIASPFVVTAEVVRDYTIIKARDNHEDTGDHGDKNNSKGNDNRGDKNDNNGVSTGNSVTVNVDAVNRLNDLLNQLHSLQNLFNSQGHSDSGKNN